MVESWQLTSHEKTGYVTVETGEGIKVDCFVTIVALVALNIEVSKS